MEITNIAPVKSRADWRAWLVANHAGEKFCWVPVCKGMWGSASKKIRHDTTLTYLDAVEEALCFGWIDSTGKDGFQRFSPRAKKSNWTELNRARAERLEQLGFMTDAGRAVVPREPFVIHPEIMRAIESDGVVLENFLKFTETYRRVRVDNIQVCLKRKDRPLFESRLCKFIQNTRDGKMYGDWNDSGRLS